MNKLYQERPRKGGGTECRLENDTALVWRRLLPVAFTAENAQKVHTGTKTQTRRLFKWHETGVVPSHPDKIVPSLALLRTARYRVGDVLWVQEPWRTDKHRDNAKPTCLHERDEIFYEGNPDHEPQLRGTGDTAYGRRYKESYRATVQGKLRPGRFMPMRFARPARYEVTAVRLERVNTISDDDCAAEGCCDRTPLQDNVPAGKFIGERHGLSAVRLRFECLWDSIHADHGTRFDDAPLVFAYTFTCIR